MGTHIFVVIAPHGWLDDSRLAFEVDGQSGQERVSRRPYASVPVHLFSLVPGAPSIECGRLDRATCDGVIGAVRTFAPKAFTDASSVVADSSCLPGSFCVFRPAAIVVVAPADWSDPDQLIAFTVSDPQGKRRPARWPHNPIPAYVLDLLPQPR